MKQVTAFKCDFCDFVREKAKNTHKHEKRCHYNPANKSCATCKHFEVVDSYYDVYAGFGEVDQRRCKQPWCNKKEAEINHWVQNCELHESKDNPCQK
jgi:hypothetical protein